MKLDSICSGFAAGCEGTILKPWTLMKLDSTGYGFAAGCEGTILKPWTLIKLDSIAPASPPDVWRGSAPPLTSIFRMGYALGPGLAQINLRAKP
jgi:hypothetical protein